MDQADSFRRWLARKARELGFEWFGITTPDPPTHFESFKDWIAAGRQGEMAYLATERAVQRRGDPRLILPECRSILALGARYATPLAHDAGAELTGRLASYAWGRDYHDHLVDLMQQLVAAIEDRLGRTVAARWYTDTGPILERDLAQRAGLGWIGKNTCLINPAHGSYFVLAEILLDVDLAPDLPFVEDRCGSCTRCIEACPTACILPDRTIDSRKCISYLTIELKGPIPPDLRSKTDNWVFGCDICQQVCPWNERFAQEQGDPAFAAHTVSPAPDLLAELQLSPQAFNHKFKGSPVKRAKRRGYLRNVAVALGNSRSPEAVPRLGRALHDDHEPLVRGHAAWALGQIGGQPARQALLEASETERDPYVQGEIRNALAAITAV